MHSIEKFSTGILGLDLIVHGGIPKGRTTLITGRSGAGKSLLALQLACTLARAGEKTIFLAVEEEPNDLATTADALEFGFAELVRSGKLTVTNLSPADDTLDTVTGDYDMTGLLHRIRGAVEQNGASVVVLDSSTALFSERPTEQRLRRLFFQLVFGFRRLGLTSIVTAEALEDYGQHTALGVEDFVCDLVITLRNLLDGGRRRRLVEVHKYRRSAHNKGEYPFTITSKGLSVYPVNERIAPLPARADRFSSGVEGLDRMNHGGWLRDSIILVRGPTGSGKTTLAGMYAKAGAERGERVVYYGFEETKPILMRNFASVGLSMEQAEASGNLRVHCRYPDSTSPEDLLIELRNELAELMPDLIVLDSISSLEHATTPTTFRHFMVGLAALIREHARSAMLTQTIASQAESLEAAPYLSTVCDAILMVDYAANEPDLARTMRVLKMRGSKHATEQHRVVFGHGGLDVSPIPREAKSSPVLQYLTTALEDFEKKFTG